MQIPRIVNLAARCLITVFVGLLCLQPLPGLTTINLPDRGDRIDVTLSDGRSFKNADVVKSNSETILILSGGTLTSFKPQDIRALKLSSAEPTAAASATATSQVPPPSPPATEKNEAKTPAQSGPVSPTRETVPESVTTEPPYSEPARSNALPIAVLTVALMVAVIYAVWLRRSTRKLIGLEKKYAGLIDADKAVAERKKESDDLGREIRQRTADREALKFELSELRKQIELFEGEQELVACGHYRPVFDFNTSEEYKKAIDEIRDQQREFIKGEQAAFCSEKWMVNGSETEGRKATKRTLRLMLRAFNGESDAIIARVSWNNIDRMLERLQAVFEAINKLGDSYKCYLNRDYLQMKRKELQLTFEHENKLKQEKDEQRELKERMRDEERARREMEDALRQTALEEERTQKALEKARAELSTASAEKESALNEKIQVLEGRLTEALKNKERALSRAQQTKSGHVYIISNIGSFGETVFKIGMTRRLDPIDRVQELSDASVPFSFDIHAMIFTDDAPAMESKLHKKFHLSRVNLINERKEFFHTTVEEIETTVKEFGATVTLTKLAEAREYRETIERRKALKPTTAAT